MNVLDNKKITSGATRYRTTLVWTKSGVALNWAIADDYVIAAVEIYNW